MPNQTSKNPIRVGTRAAVVAAGMVFSALVFAQPAAAQQGTNLDNAFAKEVISGQISAFKAKDHDGAFSYAAPTLRKMFRSTERFIGMVKGGYAPIYGAQRWTFGRYRERDGALFQEVMLVGPLGRDWVALYTLRKQADGTWKIAGVQMKPAESRST